MSAQLKIPPGVSEHLSAELQRIQDQILILIRNHQVRPAFVCVKLVLDHLKPIFIDLQILKQREKDSPKVGLLLKPFLKNYSVLNVYF